MRVLARASAHPVNEFDPGRAELGLDRIIMFPSRWDTSDEGLASFAGDVRAAHLPLAEEAPAVAAG